MTEINNVAYSWSMIQLQLQGNSNLSAKESEANPILVDCTSIKWNTDRKVESIYGLGGQPRKRGFGNVTYDASITIPYGTQMLLRSYSDDGTLLGLGEFDLVVSWVNDLGQNIISETVTLGGCLFTQGGMDASQNDTSISKEFSLNPHRIYTSTMTGSSWTRELYAGV